MSLENVSRTFIGSVVCVDLVGYSTKSVAQQIAIKEAFTRLLAAALQRVPEEERIILDTGDGAAVSLLGDPEQGLAVGLALRDASASHAAELGAARGQGAVRIGINLGPMKVALDLNGYPRIVGDGINVAEKIAAFAQPGEIVVAHSFHDMVSRLSDANAKLFRAAGTATDKNGRAHEIYVVDKPGSRSSRGSRTGTVPAAPAVATEPAPAAQPAPGAQADSAPARSAFAGFLRDPLKVGFVATLLLALIAAEAVILVRGPSPAPVPVAAAPVSAPTPAPARVEPAAPKALPAPEKAAPAKPVVPEARKAPEPIAPPPAAPAAKAPEPAPKAVEAPARPAETGSKAPPVPAAAKPEARPEPRPREPAKPAKREETAKAVIEPRPAPPVPPPEPREEPKPATAPAPPSPVATPIARAQVNFPPAAAARNIDAGSVKARLTIDAAGRVKDVQILESRPRRYFDEEAGRSLREWRFNPGADNRSYDVEIAFQR